MACTKSSKEKSRKKHLEFPYTSHFFSLLLIILGILLILMAFGGRYTSELFLDHSKSKKLEPSIVVAAKAKPKKLYIPRLSRVLAIFEGSVVDGRWAVSETGVSYFTDSAIPGSLGNSVIYGHNRKDILGNLPQISNGDIVYVVLDDGRFLKYEVFETRKVSPDQVEILNQTPDFRLTIYTCVGFLDSARFVVVARLVETS